MDRLTYESIANCTKELDALALLVSSGEYDYDQLADWVKEISWNLGRVFRRQRYASDEFQRILRGLVEARKKAKKKEDEQRPKDPRYDDGI